MSGGSCNYVFSQELAERKGDLEMIVERLEALGLSKSEACLRTRVILNLFEQIDKIAGISPHHGLRKVWRAVEWQISGDFAEDKLRDDVKEFEQSSRASVISNRPEKKQEETPEVSRKP
jgi:hypothetical protein